MTTMTAPATARDLLAALAPYGPAVEGGDLTLATDPQDHLEAALQVLHTGVRALLTGRRWFGCGSTRETAVSRVLNPAAPIPEGITLLCVEADPKWDRIDPGARSDHPVLFARS